MRKAFVSAVVAVVAVVAFAGSASANPNDTITIRPGGSITANAAGTLTLGGLINCNPVTLTGNLNTTTRQGAGPLTQVGTITSATASNCGSGNGVTFLSPTSWTISASLNNIRYAADNITVTSVELTITRVQVQVRVLGGLATCLYDSAVVGTYTPGNGRLTFNNAPLTRISGSTLCPNPGNLNGYMDITPTQAITVVP